MKFVIHKVNNLKSALDSIFNAIKSTSENICLIVPDKLTITAEKKLFEYLNIESCFNIDILTITRLSQKVLTELDINYTPINKIGSTILLKKILNEKKNDFRLFCSPSFSYDYTELLFKTITQFKSSRISPDDMVVDKNSPVQLQNKIHDLKIISEEYEKGKAGLVDPSDRLTIFARNAHKSNYIKNTHFFFLGFDDFTQQGYFLIEQLIKFSLGVDISVYTSNNANKFIYPNDVYEKLTSMARNQELPENVVAESYLDDELHTTISNQLFALEKCHVDTSHLSMKNFKNFSEEIEFVARDIRKKILSGEHFYNFGIACFDLESNKTTIKHTLDKYDINYYIDTSANLYSTFYYQYFSNYLKLINNNFKLENIIEFINSPFTKLDNALKCKFINFLQEISFNGNIANLSVPEELENIKSYLKDFLDKYPLSQACDIDAIISLVDRIKSDLNFEDELNNIIDNCSNLYDKKILMQAPTQFDTLLSNVKTFYPNACLDDIIDILDATAKDQKIMPIPQSLDCVQVLDASEILTDFDTLYLLNTNNSTAPLIIQDVGIILDKDINLMKFKNKLSPTISHLNRLAKFKLFNSCLMFNKDLFITMSIYNESELSPLVSSLHMIFGITIEEETALTHPILSKWDLIEVLSSTRDKQFAHLAQLYDIAPYTPTTTLTDEIIRQLNMNEISCSTLEKYFNCPMSFFLNNILKIKSERDEGIASVDIGNILHKLAEEYYKSKSKTSNTQNFVCLVVDKFMKQDAKLKNLINTPIYHNLIKEGVRFVNHLKYLDNNCQFTNTKCEYNFGFDLGNTLPLTNDVYLKGKIDRIDFFENYVRIIDYKTGNADASIDELYYGNKLQLFLYGWLIEKTLSKQLAGSFYLPIHNSFESSEEKPYKLNGFYLADNTLLEAFDKNIKTNGKSDLMNLSLDKNGDIKVDKRSTKVLYPSDFNNLIEYSVKISQQAISEIQSGNVATSPLKISEQKTSCDYCPYLAICRKNSSNIPFREKNKVNLNSFGGNDEENI